VVLPNQPNKNRLNPSNLSLDNAHQLTQLLLWPSIILTKTTCVSLSENCLSLPRVRKQKHSQETKAQNQSKTKDYPHSTNLLCRK